MSGRSRQTLVVEGKGGISQDENISDVLDLKHLEQLESLKVSGKRSLFSELAALFCSEMPPRLEQLRAAVLGHDAVAVARLAHAMIGSAATVGGRQLQSELRLLEKAAPSDNWSSIETQHRSVDQAWIVLLNAIKQRLEKQL